MELRTGTTGGTIERHFIDMVEQESHCQGCGSPLIVGDVAWLNQTTLTIGCCIACVRYHDKQVADHLADIRNLETCSEGGTA